MKSAVIIYSDIVGYNAQKIRDADQAKSLLQKNSVLHRTVIQKFNGKILKSVEDEIMATFRSSLDAVQCAIEIQQGARKKGYSLRIGIHSGKISFEEEETKGEAIDVAMELQRLSEKNGITVSESIFSSISNKKVVSFEEMGEKFIESINDNIDLYKINYPEERNEIDIIQNVSKNKSWYPFIILGIIFAIFLILTILRKFFWRWGLAKHSFAK